MKALAIAGVKLFIVTVVTTVAKRLALAIAEFIKNILF